jgi:hypothetical protein
LRIPHAPVIRPQPAAVTTLGSTSSVWLVYVSAPPVSSATETAGQPAQVEVPGPGTREVTLDPGASADTPARRQGPGRSLPGPDAGHPLQAGCGHEGNQCRGRGLDENMSAD